LVLWISLCYSDFVCGDDPGFQVPEEYLDRVVNPSSMTAARHARDLLWNTNANWTSQTLQSHDQLNVSLRAAWQRVIGTVHERTAPHIHYIPEERAVYRFAGFVEGRLGIAPPEWWISMLVQIKSQDRDTYLLPTESIPAYGDSVAGFGAPSGLNITSNNGAMEITVGGGTVLIKEEIVSHLAGCGHRINACRVENAVFVASHSWTTGCLVSIDNTGEQAWSANIWGADSEPIRQADPGRHFIELVADDTNVYVFGGANNSAYIEAFRQDDGESVFRFSTSY
jgi:hypothetical protein